MNAPLEAGIAPFVLSRVDGGVCHLTLNRGERYNALSRDMIAALRSELARIATDPAIRCVVLGAEGKGFCAGHDLKELRAHPVRAGCTPSHRRPDRMPAAVRARSAGRRPACLPR